jgi:hypothetical protein
MIRFLRDEPSSVDRCGLTGNPDIPDPPPKDRVRGIRARLKAAGPVIVGTFRGMPRKTRLAVVQFGLYLVSAVTTEV